MRFISQILPLTCLLFMTGCSSSERTLMERWKSEIIETEQNFAKMAKEKGIQAAFLEYAATDAVLMRNNDLVVGKDSIREYFDNQGTESKDVKLSWKPDFVDVSTAGDLGYSYGHYTLIYPDSSGALIEKHGIFHTVWKRQSDGSWRFVWD